MKLIIYWLTLMIILPVIYLYWRKKPWRLILGVIIVVVLIGGYWLPGKLAFSILQRELKKVEEKMDQEGWSERGKEKERWQWEKLDEEIKNVSQQEITPENQEKIAAAKEIIKWKEAIQKSKEERDKLDAEENYYLRNQEIINKNPSSRQEWEEKRKKNRKRMREEISPKMAKGYKMEYEKKWEYARKWGGKEDPPFFWFCGEEFNYELTKSRTGFKLNWKIVEDWDWHTDVIDFGKHRNEKPSFVKKRIREIWDYWGSGITRGGGL